MRRVVSIPRRIPIGMALFAVAVAVPMLRQAGGAVPVWHTLYAEDGSIYLADARTRPLLSTLVRPYSGYWQLIDRVAALPMRWLPLDIAAWFFVLLGCVINALLALFVYRWSAQFIARTTTRLALAGLAVAAPVLATELTANVSDLVFLLPFACFWALISHAQTRWGVTARAAIAAITGASTPLGALLVPLAIAGVVKKRRGAGIVGTALLASVALQGLVIATAPDHGVRSGGSLAELGILYPARVVVSYLVSERYAATVWTRGGTVAVLIAASAVAAALVIMLRSERTAARRPALLAIGYSVAVFAVAVVARGTSALHLAAGSWNGNGPRYVAVPLLLLASGLAMSADPKTKEASASWVRRFAPALFTLHVVVTVAVGFWSPTDRNNGPAWADSLRAARQTCEQTRQSTVAIPITPAPEFNVTLPCSRLDP